MSRRRSWWVPHPSEVYVVAEADSEAFASNADVVQVVTDDGQTLKVKKQLCVEIGDRDWLSEQCDDLILLREVNEATILHTLRDRFKQDKIYTAIGTVLVSLNPFRAIEGLYDEETRRQYSKAMYSHTHDTLPPHVFVIAASAFNNMRINHVPQSILISGESGAGKTEATKQCLQFLSSSTGTMEVASADGEMTIEEKVIAASPILEAFGNAKTVRNDNSSRFGKWMNILFRKSAPSMVQMVACQTTSYLLEKSRVTNQDADERNFHIFYQLLTSKDESFRSAANLRNPESYWYLAQSGCTTLETQDDAMDFQEVLASFTGLGFEAETVQCILSITAAVLTLGNINFDPINDGEGSKLSASSRDELDTICNLLQVRAEILEQSLVAKTIQIGNSRRSLTTILLKPAEAAASRDALARNMFQKLFEKIIAEINRHSLGDGAQLDDGLAIGILDIFGFEIFTTNSLEQLCINYANEALQKHFNNHIFTLETQLYAQEGVHCEQIAFRDNTQVISLIQTAFAALDEEGRIPKGTAETFFSKFKRTHSDGKHKQLVEFPALRPTFKIVHYAGSVEYEPTLFMVKNKDTYSANLVAALQASSSTYISELFAEPASEPGSPTSRSSAKGRETVTGLFRGQMQALVTNLEETKSHFIRCVKSNASKKPREMDALLVYEQLRCSGVLEIVQIQQSGLPFRYKHEDFVKRCSPIVRWRFREHQYDPTELPVAVDDVVSDLIRFYPDLEFQVGKTMVFYTANENRILETALQYIQQLASVSMQRYIRGFVCRILRRTLTSLRQRAAEAVRERDSSEMQAILEKLRLLQERYQRLTGSIVLQQDIARGETALARFILQDKCAQRLEAVLQRDLFEHVAELEEILAEADSLEFDIPLVQQGKRQLATARELLGSLKLLESDMSHVSTEDLERACTSVSASMDQVRTAFPDRDVQKMLTRAETRLAKLRVEVDRYFPRMAAALGEGAVSFGPSGECQSDSGRTVLLTQTFSEFNNVSFESEDCNAARTMIDAVIQLRRALVQKNVQEAEQALQACHRVGLPAVLAIVQEELKSAQAYIISEQSVQQLEQAFAAQRLPDHMPLHYPTPHLRAFKAVVDRVTVRKETLLPFAEFQLKCMQLMYDLRCALTDGQLQSAIAAVTTLRTLQQSDGLPAAVAEECGIAEQHITFFQVRDGLDEIVQAGPRVLEQIDVMGDVQDICQLQPTLDDMTRKVEDLQRQASSSAAVVPLVARVQLLLSLRYSLLRQNVDEIDAKLKNLRSSHVGWVEAAAEVQQAQRIFELLKLRNELMRGLSEGRVQWSGETVDVDVASISDVALRAALEQAASIDQPPTSLVLLIKACNVIRQARLVVLGKYTFEQLNTIVRSLTHINPLPPTCADEVAVLRELRARAFATEATTDLLQTAVANGTVGSLKILETSESELLEKLSAVQQAVAEARLTPTLSELASACEYMTVVRCAVLARDWAVLRQLLSNKSNQLDNPAASRELQLIEAEIQHEDTIAALVAGCAPLNFTSEIGELSAGEIGTQQLEDALLLAETHGTYNERSIALRSICQQLRGLRRKVREKDFGAIEEHALDDLEHRMARQQLDVVEVRRFRHELQNHVAVRQLKTTLQTVVDVARSSQERDELMSNTLEWCERLTRRSMVCNHLVCITRYYLQMGRSTLQQRYRNVIEHVDALLHELEQLGTCDSYDDPELLQTIKHAATSQRRLAEGRLLAAELEDLLTKSQIRGKPFHLLFDAARIKALDAFVQSKRQGGALRQYDEHRHLLSGAAASLHIRKQVASDRQHWFKFVTEQQLIDAGTLRAHDEESRILMADFLLRQACNNIEECFASTIFIESPGAATPAERQEVLTELGKAVNVLLKASEELPSHVYALAAVGNEFISIGYEWAAELAHHSLPVVTELNASLQRRVGEVERQLVHLSAGVQQSVRRTMNACVSHYEDALMSARIVDLLQQVQASITSPELASSSSSTRQQKASALTKVMSAGIANARASKMRFHKGRDDTAALLEVAQQLCLAARLVSFGVSDRALHTLEQMEQVALRIPRQASATVQHLKQCFLQFLRADDAQSPDVEDGPLVPKEVNVMVTREHYRDITEILPTPAELTATNTQDPIYRRSLLVSFADHPDLYGTVMAQRRADVMCDLLAALGTLASSITNRVSLADVLESPDEFLYVDYWRIHCVLERVPIDDPAFTVGTDELAAVLVDIAKRLLKLVKPSRPVLGLQQSSELLDLLDVPFSDLLVDEGPQLQSAATRWAETATQVKSLMCQVSFGAQILENFQTDEEDLQLANEVLEAIASELAMIAAPADCSRILHAADIVANLRSEAQAPSTDEQFSDYLANWSSLPQLLRAYSEEHINNLKKAHQQACHRRHVDDVLEKLSAEPLDVGSVIQGLQKVYEEVLQNPEFAIFPDELHMWEALLSITSLDQTRTASLLESKVTTLQQTYQGRVAPPFFKYALFECKKQQILEACWDYVHTRQDFPDHLLGALEKGRDKQVDYVLDAVPVLRQLWKTEVERAFDEEVVVELCSRNVEGLYYLRDAIEYSFLLANREQLIKTVHAVELKLTGDFANDLFASPNNPTPEQQNYLVNLADQIASCKHVPMGITLQHWLETVMRALALITAGREAKEVQKVAQMLTMLPGSDNLRDFGAQLAAFLEWRCAAVEIAELLAHGVAVLNGNVVAPSSRHILRLFQIGSHMRGHVKAGRFADLVELLIAMHELRVTATCEADLGDKLPMTISRAKAALTRVSDAGLGAYVPHELTDKLRDEIDALANYIPSYMTAKALKQVLASRVTEVVPLEAAIAFAEQFDNLDEHTFGLLQRARLVLKLRKAQSNDAWLVDIDQQEHGSSTVEQIVQEWFACQYERGPGTAEFLDARNLCAEHRFEAFLEELESNAQDDDKLLDCLERMLQFATNNRVQLGVDAYEEVDACMAVYYVLLAYNGQRWGIFWQQSRSLRIFSTGLPLRLQFLTPVLERIQKTYHEALLCDYLLSVLLNVERPVAKTWFEDNKTLLATLENCMAWAQLEPLIQLLMTGSMTDVVAEWTKSASHLKTVLDSADENDLLVAALVARLCLLKRTYLSDVAISLNTKIFSEAETIDDALKRYPLVHSMLESVREYQLDKVDLELRNIDDCWNLLFYFSDCTGNVEKTERLATIPNAIQAQRVRHLLYEKFQSQTALDMTIQINTELQELGQIIQQQTSMIDCMHQMAWHYATLDGLLKKSKAIMLQSGSSIFENLQLARTRGKLVRALRQAVLQHNWTRVAELVTEIRRSVHGPFLADETDAADALRLHHKHLNDLHQQLANGPCGGELGAMDEATDDINLDELQQVLSGYMPSRTFAISHEIEQLRNSAIFILRVREAVVEGMWENSKRESEDMAASDKDGDIDSVAALLQQPIALQPIPATAAEIQRVRDELHNKTAAVLLAEALSGGASYVENINDFRIVDCDVLQDAISKAVALGRKSARVQILLPAAQKVRQLRLVVANGEWSKLRSLLEELKGDDVPPEIAQEVNALRKIDHINFALQEKILSAITKGRVRGIPTQLDITDVAVTDLNAALVFAAQRNIHSKADQSLIRTAELLRDLRLCVLSSDFEKASERLKTSTVSSIHQAAKEELLLIEATVETIDVLEELTQALLLDAPTGAAGSFSTASVKTRRIENVLTSTTTSELESMNQLAPSIRAIRDLRSAICSGKWDERVVAQNPVLRKAGTATFRTIQLIQTDTQAVDVGAESISHQLYKKLASSALSSKFRSAVAPRPVAVKEVPIAASHSTGSFNPDSRDMFDSTITVTRALQMLGLSQDSVAFAMSRLPAKLSRYTEQEVRLVRNELYHRIVCHALEAAILPMCTADDPSIAMECMDDADGMEYEEKLTQMLHELEGAMWVAHHLGLPSPQSRRLYNTAFAMYSVRKAELSTEWDATNAIANLVNAGKNQQLFEDYIYQEVQLACARHQLRVITSELERQLSLGDVVFETRSDMQKLRQAWQRGMPGAHIDEESLVMLDITHTLHHLHLANKSRNFDAVRKCCDELTDVLDRLPAKFQQFRHLLEIEVSHQRRTLLEQKLPFLNFGSWMHSEAAGLTHLQGVLSRLIQSALAPFFQHMANKNPAGVAFETTMIKVNLKRHALLRQFLDQSNKVLASVSAEGRNHPELRRQFLQTAYSAVFVLATSLLCVRELLKPEPSESSLPRLRSRSNSHNTVTGTAATNPTPRNATFMLGLQPTVNCIPQVVCSAAADALNSLAIESTRRDHFSSSTTMGQYVHQVANFAIAANFGSALQELLSVIDPEATFTVTQLTLSLLRMERRIEK